MVQRNRSTATTSTRRGSGSARGGVTLERFTRLYRLVQLLASGPKTRAVLSRRLRLDVRGFYRDLEVLRSAGVAVSVAEGHYRLGIEPDQALALLPFPDPLLTLGEARQIARGKTQAHQKLRDLLDRLDRGE